MQPNEAPKFDFQHLIILDMANNHQGSVEHGKRIIQEHAKVVKEAGVRAAIKFQFRNLDTFIHPSHLAKTDNRHVGRFLSTRLYEDDFRILADEVRSAGFVTMATPFDEDSVDMIERLGIQIIKIASCSATDWPLLERVVDCGKPIVVSTAGLPLEQVDDLVSFFDHRGTQYALMHCVSLYPTPPEKLNLKRIKIFCQRYPHITVGFSTHEDPDNTDAIKIAYTMGARVFERHVGVETESIQLNSYSSRPMQLAAWLKSFHDAVVLHNGNDSDIDVIDFQERVSLSSLARGVYAKQDIKKGMIIKRSDVYFAMPAEVGQMTSGQFKERYAADQDYMVHQPISASVIPNAISMKRIIYKAIHDVKGMLHMANIFVNYDSNVSLSHHYGLEKFDEYGAVIIDCINREYCKKIIVMLPGQTHPKHYHKKKEETFQLLAGELHVEVEGRKRTLAPGDTIIVPRGVWHDFSAPQGAIFEEISTTHFYDDSFYADKGINKMPLEERKTQLIYWGRHQFEEVE